MTIWAESQSLVGWCTAALYKRLYLPTSIKTAHVKGLNALESSPSSSGHHPSHEAPSAMPKELPLEIYMLFADQAFKECQQACMYKYKLPGRCCDACHAKLRASLRFCSPQSSHGQYFAAQMFRTIRFTENTLARRLETLINDHSHILPSVEDIIVVFEDEVSDVRGVPCFLSFPRTCRTNASSPAVTKAISTLLAQAFRNTFTSLKTICLELGTDSLILPNTFAKAAQHAVEWRLKYPAMFELHVLDRNSPSAKLTVGDRKVDLSIVNKTIFPYVDAGLHCLDWVDAVAACVTDLSMQRVILEIPATAFATILAMSNLRTLAIRDVRLASYSPVDLQNWSEMWQAGSPSWMMLRALTVERTAYVNSAGFAVRHAEDELALQAFQRAVRRRPVGDTSIISGRHMPN